MAQSATSTSSVTINELSFTEDGGFYVSGMVNGTADVDPGVGVANVTCSCGAGSTGWYGKYNATWRLALAGTGRRRYGEHTGTS